MPLTNAERQKRHRERLKEKAGSPGLMLRAACLQWIEEMRAEWMEENKGAPDPDMQRLDILRREIEGLTDMDRAFLDLVNYDMEARLRRTRVPKPATGRRSRPAVRP